MFVTYSPADGDEQRWEFLADQVLDTDAEAIEKAYVDNWDNWLVTLLRGGMRARRVLLWHLIKTAHPSLKFADLPSFRVGELAVEFDREELELVRAGIADENSSRGLDEATRESLLEHLDAELVKAPERSTGGKARSKPSGKSTPSP